MSGPIENSQPVDGLVIEERRRCGPPDQEDIIVLYGFGVWFPIHEGKSVYADGRANTTLCLVV